MSDGVKRSEGTYRVRVRNVTSGETLYVVARGPDEETVLDVACAVARSRWRQNGVRSRAQAAEVVDVCLPKGTVLQ